MLYLKTVCACVVAALAVYKWFLYPVWLSPLARIPCAHSSCRISSVWLIWMRSTFGDRSAFNAAHRKHGDVVLVGPNELSIRMAENGVNVIARSFNKTAWWDIFESFSHRPLSGILDKSVHSKRRRMPSNVLSSSYLRSSQDWAKVLTSIVHDSQAFFQKAQSPVEVHAWTMAVPADYISAYTVGVSNGTRFVADPEKQKSWYKMFTEHQVCLGWMVEAPRLSNLLLRLGTTPWPTTCQQSFLAFEQITSDLCATLGRTLDSKPEQGTQQTSAPVLFDAWKEGFSKELGCDQQDVVLDKIKAETLDELRAGAAGISPTLTYLIFELSNAPSAQRRLHEEFASLEIDASNVSFDNPLTSSLISELDQLPFLEACVQETFRYAAPIVGGIERQVPPEGCSLGEYPEIPGGVTVMYYPYCLGRNEQVFGNADVWQPERWLETPDLKLSQMKKHVVAFGNGTYSCNAVTFTTLGIKVFLWALYSTYRTELLLSPDTKPLDGTSIYPEDGALYIKLNPIK